MNCIKNVFIEQVILPSENLTRVLLTIVLTCTGVISIVISPKQWTLNIWLGRYLFLTVGQIISIGCAHNCSESERQESGSVALVGWALLTLAVWPVSAKTAPEIPYHCSHSSLLGAQGVQLCHMQSLENAIFPIHNVNGLVYLWFMTFSPFMWLQVFAVTKQLLSVCQLEYN